MSQKSARFLINGAIFAPDLGDLSEMRRRYTVSGTPSVVNTPLGKGMMFNGTTDSIAVATADNPQFNLTANFTICAWVFKPATALGYVFAKRGTGQGPNLYINTGNEINLVDGGGTIRTGGQTFAVNAWNHVAVTVSNTTAYTYLNGVAAATPVITAYGGNVVDVPYVGQRSTTGFFPGSIVCLVMFGRTLSTAEVLSLAQNRFF